MFKIIFILFLITFNAQAKLKVITTTTNLADLVTQIAGDLVEVESLCRGTQDPHFLEAKPSYIFKLSKADLLVSVGAGLEVGWLPLIIRGSRKPDLRVGQKGHLVAASFINLLEKNPVSISRSLGDIHPEGNPHFMLGPMQSLKVAKGLVEKLSNLDKDNLTAYQKNFLSYETKLKEEIKRWKSLLSPGTKVITYHRTLSYFYKEFEVLNVDVLEPKPGIPPSAAHIIALIAKMKEQKIYKIIVENYFDDSVAKRIKKEIPKVKIEVVPVGVDGVKGISSLFKLYDYLALKVGS